MIFGKKIVDCRTTISDRKATIHAAPQFVRLGGNWQPIATVLTSGFVDEAYTVALSSGAWIRLALADSASREIIVAARTDNIVKPRRFGPIIDTAKLTSDRIQWRVTTSGNVTRLPNGDYRFSDVEGVELGLSFRDWRTTFGKKINSDGNVVELDFADFRQCASPPIINLDPDVELDDSSIRKYYNSDFSTISWAASWTACREAAAADSNAATATASYSLVTAGPNKITALERFLVKFDVTGYENATQAIFETADIGLVGGESHLRLCQCTTADIQEPPADYNANYYDIYQAFGKLATLTASEEGAIDWWRSSDLVAAGLFNTSAGSVIFYGVADQADATNSMPSSDTSRYTTVNESGWTRLTLTLPSSTLIALTGAGA